MLKANNTGIVFYCGKVHFYVEVHN